MKYYLIIALAIFFPLFANATTTDENIIEELRGTSTIPSIYNNNILINPPLAVHKNKIIDNIEIGTTTYYSYYSDRSLIKETFYKETFYKENIRLRTSNSRTYKIDNDLYYTEIYTKPVFIKNANGYWYDVKVATTTTDYYKEKTAYNFIDYFLGYSVLADDIDIYTGAGDGYVYNNSISWDGMHNAVNGSSADYTSGSGFVSCGDDFFDDYFCEQAFFIFDTRNGYGNIVSSTFNVFIEDIELNDNDAQAYIMLVEMGQSATSSLSNSDWSTMVVHHHNIINLSSEIDIDTIVDDDWLSISLNSTGLDVISSSDYTNLGLLEGHFVEDAPYSGLFDENAVRFATSEDVFENIPYLSITYVAISPPITMNLETGNLNQSVKYTEVYNENGVMIGYEYSINHNPFITFSVFIFSSMIAGFFIWQIVKVGWSKKNKLKL